MKFRIEFRHSTRLTSSVHQTVNQKIGNIKETYSFKFAVLLDMFPKTGNLRAYSTRRLIVPFKLHLEGLQQVHLFCHTSKTPLSPTIRQSSLYQRGRASFSRWGRQQPKMSHHKLAPWHKENGNAPYAKTRQLRSLHRCKPADRPSSKKMAAKCLLPLSLTGHSRKPRH